MSLLPSQPAGKLWAGALAVVLFLVLASVAWIERDAYRFAAAILVVWGSVLYLRADFRPSIGWMGLICIAWVAFIAIRYAILYFDPAVLSHGTSEGIYLLPIFYMTVGYMMYRYRETLGATVMLFILISFVMAAATLPLSSLFDEGQHPFLVMKNTIHSSVGAGLIILASINFAGFAARNFTDARQRLFCEAVSYATIALCFIGLYGAKSKGVWAAMAIALCVQLLLAARKTNGMRRWLTGAVLLGALALFVSVFSFGIWSTIGPTYEEASAIVAKILQTGHPIQTIQQAIASDDIPVSMQIRLMLWLNAIEVLSRNVLFGSGIAWKDYWLQAHYSDTGFDLLHNGYLEIAVRYGLLGLAFYTILYAWTARTAYKAFQRGLIPIEAFNAHIVLLVFFLVTIASNSNNRLAIGESYMMLAGAFGFFCHYLCQRAAVPAGKLEPA